MHRITALTIGTLIFDTYFVLGQLTQLCLQWRKCKQSGCFGQNISYLRIYFLTCDGSWEAVWNKGVNQKSCEIRQTNTVQ